MPRLRRSNCAAPGIARRRRGRGFEYRDPDGERIDDSEALERIAELAIPPAWREVWICMDPQGHLQATGFDAAGRKQYLYHSRWRTHRDRLKFDSMIAFGEALPRVRRRVARELGRGAHNRSAAGATRTMAAADLTRGRVLACAVRLLDLGFFRIGSEDYAEHNESYGLTTMLREHVSIDDGELVFDFPAKSGRRRVQAITDGDALGVVAALKRRRGGSQLLAYREAGHWVELHADDVNAYIKQHSGGDFTAKDFRTWNATVLAAVALGSEKRPKSRMRQERVVTQAVKTVAAYLGNTPAVCRASYIDPRVIDRYHAGITIAPTLAELSQGPDLADVRTRKLVEAATLELLGSDR
ncbi:MAG TPA: DNA topoisomerase IB [Solirubrobacteraceae bacterium]|nr:DNA topoisomerase IB [Solirubrobacteraceae bacterium]